MEKVFIFLKKLAKNNNKDWFDKHKEEYLAAKDEFEIYLEDVIKDIKRFDKKIDPATTAKKSMFRIYRDVRFSKDKTPYKIHFSGSINPGGKKSLEAGYYLQVEPGNCFVAGGVYNPEPDQLQAIRQEIDYNGKSLDKIMKAPAFKKFFKGFEDEDRMKTAPKGYNSDHPYIEHLKNRHFLLCYNLSDEDVKGKNGRKKIAEAFKAMYPMMKFLREASE